MNKAHRIDLEMFEGPLDLLLFLIKRDELNIYDIPIATITKNFLDYVELAKELKLHSAGDFILMAATLMKIKARMLLPIEADGDDEIEGRPLRPISRIQWRCGKRTRATTTRRADLSIFCMTTRSCGSFFVPS